MGRSDTYHRHLMLSGGGQKAASRKADAELAFDPDHTVGNGCTRRVPSALFFEKIHAGHDAVGSEDAELLEIFGNLAV